MTQSAFYRSVARVTGESLRTVRHMGFVLVTPNKSRKQRLDRPTGQPSQQAHNEGAEAGPQQRTSCS